jgi:hypothetical protein
MFSENWDADRRDEEISEAVYQKYNSHYDGEIQGCCMLIADEIAEQVNGIRTAGYLLWSGGQRSHWWVEKQGKVFDPMGDELLKQERAGRRKIEHQDIYHFRAILPQYERWRIR